MDIYLIRHFKTKGDLENRFIGVTDEHILKEELPESFHGYPKVEAVVVTPMSRCAETARYLYPDMPIYISGKMRECDFGLFENRNEEELKDFPWYQQWMDSFGKLPFPAGEPRESFRKRCVRGFQESVDMLIEKQVESAAFIVHSGTIVSIMENFVSAKKFQNLHVENGRGFRITLDSELWKQGKREISVVGEAFRLQENRMSQ